MANVGRREVWHRLVNFHRERKLGEGGEAAGGATPWSERPDEEKSVRRGARTSSVPKISGNQSWVAIEPW